ncbi:Zn-dependent hydrolases of the beta-lactamase protein [Penicillium riverlandense]|uniref:Zn-dependent hydrolases of the beta-lactamase protein n=1 Tax=Penicillium riverlandense TaxID=1903569 RepID=UPI0025493CFF|nr:Zn-dependent hydrolases of the beta-lactamase protein [Penicillium riverlandense]KAJ5825344.1 Zn-dependent hydrolases of the beta-lactamase protein [Penicillium riverlandense]
MSPSTFQSSLSITHIGTATAIFKIDDVNLLTDPFFSPAGTTWDVGSGNFLKNTETPALGLENLPVIDAILLSHEDHPDNLDDFGRQLLNGRLVFTTVDGANNLAPRPGVRGMKPWETASTVLRGVEYDITATPCKHLPGGECTGFILSTAEFGVGPDGRPNAIYFTGDTVYIDELAMIPEKFHIVAAVMNLGSAHAALPDGLVQITMDGKQAAHLFRTIKADKLVPMHYESWDHFTQFGQDLVKVFKEEGIFEDVCWLTPGKSVKII